jgi:hypothetical protein
VQAHLADGRLARVLGDWRPPFSGYHLYYQAADNPRQPSPSWWMRCAIDRTCENLDMLKTSNGRFYGGGWRFLAVKLRP